MHPSGHRQAYLLNVLTCHGMHPIHKCVASMIHPPGMQVPSIHLLYHEQVRKSTSMHPYCQYRIYALHNSIFLFPTCITHSGFSVVALGTSTYSYYSCKLDGEVVGTPVNSSSLEAAARSCNHQQHSACTVDYENGDGGCTAELIGTQLSPCVFCIKNDHAHYYPYYHLSDFCDEKLESGSMSACS